MTSVVMAPELARKNARAAVEDLRRTVISFLETTDGSSSLHELLEHLQREGASDDTISRAVSGMLAAGEVRLTSQRRVRLMR